MSDPQVIKALEELIKKEGSQEKAAKKLGLTQSAISRYQNGSRNPPPEVLEKLGFRKREVYEKIRN